MLVAWYCSICCKKVTYSGVYAPKSDEEMSEFEDCLRASGLSESVIEYVRMKKKTLSKVRVCTWHVSNYSKLNEPQCKARSQNILPEFVENPIQNPSSPTQIAETMKKLADQIYGNDSETSNVPSLEMGLPKDESPSECSISMYGEDRDPFGATKNVEVPLLSKKRRAIKRTLDEESLQIEDLIENRRQRLMNSSLQINRIPILTSQIKGVSSEMPSTSALQSTNERLLNDLLDIHSPIRLIDPQIAQVPNVEVQQQSETLSLIKGSYFLIPGDMLLKFLQNCRCEENLSERLLDVPKGDFPFVHSTCPCGGMQVYRGLPKL